MLDTGVFDQDRYFDVFVEYAKASPEDVLIQLTICNRGAESATLHVLPTVLFRNTWSWGGEVSRPVLRQAGRDLIAASHPDLGERFFSCENAAALLFTENETNTERLFGTPNRTPYVKDGIDNYIVHSRHDAVNPDQTGTKASAHYPLTIGAGGDAEHPPAAPRSPSWRAAFGSGFDAVMEARRKEADEFYATVIPPSLDADAANVMRQALAGMLWSKQFYYYDVDRWLEERGADPFKASTAPWPTQRPLAPHAQCPHPLDAGQVGIPVVRGLGSGLSRPCLDLGGRGLRQAAAQSDARGIRTFTPAGNSRPTNGISATSIRPCMPGPPSSPTGWRWRGAAKAISTGSRRSFHKLLLNFTWWVNRKDRTGNNAFEGGFLGLDNIGVFDRSAPLPTGGYLEQADGTAWMALFCQNMLEIAAELAWHKPVYVDMALKFVEHFLWIANALYHAGEGTGMWDEQDGFFYDVLRLPDGGSQRLKVRSLVGLLPLCAVTVFDGKLLERDPELARARSQVPRGTSGAEGFHPRPDEAGHAGRRLAAILDESKLRRVLATMLDEKEFLSPYGIRSLSRYHAEHPYVFRVGGPGVPGLLSAGGVRQRHVRRQLQLARTDLDARQCDDHPRPAPVLRVLWR